MGIFEKKAHASSPRQVHREDIVDMSRKGAGVLGVSRALRKHFAARAINNERARELRERLSAGVENPYISDYESVRVLHLVNTVLAKYFARIGLPFEPITPERIERNTPYSDDEEVWGLQHSHDDKLTVNSKLKGYHHFTTLLHEAIHDVSVRNFRVSENPDTYYPQVYRTGYRVESHEKSQFIGFNEGVVEMTVLHIIDLFKDEIQSELRMIEEDLPQEVPASNNFNVDTDHHSYQLQVSFVDDVLVRMAKKSLKKLQKEGIGISFKQALLTEREKMIRGQFTGNMMHLREIEKLFGRGALRFVSALTGNDAKDKNIERQMQFHRFLELPESAWAKRLHEAGKFIPEGEMFAGYVLAVCPQLLSAVRSLVATPVPEYADRAYAKKIGLCVGVTRKIMRKIGYQKGPHAQQVAQLFGQLHLQAERLRDDFMHQNGLTSKQVKVRVIPARRSR